MSEEISLAFEDEQKEEPVEELPQEDSQEASLTEEELKQVNEFVDKIDLSNSSAILNYGTSAQKKISEFSDNTLEKVRSKDLGDSGKMLSDLVVELKGFDITKDDKGIVKFFKQQGNKVVGMKAKFDDASKNVEKIASNLESHQIQLMKDIAVLDELYNHNLTNFKELTMYILAGKKKIEKAKNEELAQLQAKAQQSGLPEDAQKANDYAQLIERFEKKIYDLELTRNVALQMGPQIRLVQSNNTKMVEKIQSTLNNTLPLWKSQMVLAVGLEHTNEAIKSQQAVDEVTNNLLKSNAETLKQGTIAAAKQSEQGIVDLETLKETNKKLIDTLDEVLKIQDEGRAKRAEAELELNKIESELKSKLLQAKK